ncbi:hypothetical protein ACVWYG_002900 [Pedobacter sp. UYEF25]
MIGISNYHNYVAKHNLSLTRYEGIIIWDAKFGAVPQDVLFFPSTWNRQGSFKEFLLIEIQKPNATVFQVYFQGMRWILPDLEERIINTKSVEIFVGSQTSSCRASYVAITFGSYTPDEEVFILEETNNLQISISNVTRQVKLKDWPNEFGIAKLYEPIAW